MEKIYRDINHPAGLSSIQKLYDEVKKNDPQIKKSDVKKFLSSKNSYTLHKHNGNRFPRRRFYFKQPGYYILSDVAYMKDYEKQNTPYLLILIDGYSRYLTVIPLKSLRANEVKQVLDTFLTNSIYSYRKIFTDCGQEYRSGLMKSLYKKHKILWYTTYNKTIKVSIAERVILTLKNKIKRYVTEFNTEYYLDVLDDIVKAYNLSKHRSLHYKTPLDVHLLVKWKDIKQFSSMIYKADIKKRKTVGNVLSENQVVRIVALRHTFTRAIHVRNTYELFKISRVNNHHIPITYTLSDLDDNPIEGTFYRQELTEVEDTGDYAIEILKTRRRSGKKEFLIRYVHYPSSPKVWVSQNKLKKLN